MFKKNPQKTKHQTIPLNVVLGVCVISHQVAKVLLSNIR